MKKKNESQGTLLEQLSESKGQCLASPGTFITWAAWHNIYYAFAETIDEEMCLPSVFLYKTRCHLNNLPNFSSYQVAFLIFRIFP